MDNIEGKQLLTGRFIAKVIRGGEVIEEFVSKNIVVNVGIQHTLDSGIVGGTWYVGLLGNVTPAAGTVLGDLTGTEVTNYDETARPAWTEVRSSQTVSNTAAPATFTISTGGATVYGAFVTEGSVKGTDGGGDLLAAALFSGGSRALNAADELVITYEITGSSS